MNSEEKGFNHAIKKNKDDKTARSAYADWLDEHDRKYEAAIQRAKAGLSTICYKVRRKSDGFFSSGRSYGVTWRENGGKSWSRLCDVVSHINSESHPYNDQPRKYSGLPLDEIEIAFVETRISLLIPLPLREEIDPDSPRRHLRSRIKTTEPIGE